MTSAQLVLSCKSLDETIHFFKNELSFRLDSIFPADDPSTAVISSHGIAIRLVKDGNQSNALIRIEIEDAKNGALTAPNGARVELVSVDNELALPESKPSFEITRIKDEANWISGRAGMRYRDLIPSRQNGRFIASHIVIPNGGRVPDYVHYHKVRFQMIYCYKGWVRVVYEDQGEPFVMQAGDCVLQPPEIRHRVLESSKNCEVIEIGCPAEHETLIEHEIELPTATVNAQRVFSGQRFVHHVAKLAQWKPWRASEFEYRDTGIGEATGGLAGVRVVKNSGSELAQVNESSAEFQMYYVLAGECLLSTRDHGDHQLDTGDCVVMPGAHSVHAGSKGNDKDRNNDFELLEVTLPAGV